MGCGSSRLHTNNGADIPTVKARPHLFLRFDEFKRRRHVHSQQLKDSTTSKKGLLLDDREEDDIACRKVVHDDHGKDDSSSLLLQDDNGSCVTSEGSPPKRAMEKEDDAEDKSSIENGVHEGKIDEPLAKDDDDASVNADQRNMDGDAKIIEHEHEHEDDQDEDEDDDDQEEEDDYDNVGRTIKRHEDDPAYLGSPSFRVYFTDNKGDNKNQDADDDHLTKIAPIDNDPKPLKVPVTQEQMKKEKNKRRSFKKVLPMSKQAKSLFNVRGCIKPSANSSYDHRTHLLTAKAI